MDAPISSPSTKGAASSISSSSQPSASVSASSIPMPPPAQVKQPSTDALLKDFSLVAEAAKRAQVAVMVRDFENCGL